MTRHRLAHIDITLLGHRASVEAWRIHIGVPNVTLLSYRTRHPHLTFTQVVEFYLHKHGVTTPPLPRRRLPFY